MAHVETKAKRSVKRSLESASRREERRRREVAGRDVMVVLAAFGEGEHGVDVEAREGGGARAVFELQGEARAKEAMERVRKALSAERMLLKKLTDARERELQLSTSEGRLTKETQRLLDALTRAQTEIDRLILEEKDLTTELDRLENDDEYIKKIARERFHMVKPGEKVFRVIDRRKVKKDK